MGSTLWCVLAAFWCTSCTLTRDLGSLTSGEHGGDWAAAAAMAGAGESSSTGVAQSSGGTAEISTAVGATGRATTGGTVVTASASGGSGATGTANSASGDATEAGSGETKGGGGGTTGGGGGTTGGGGGECSGSLHLGVCWYLAEPGTSCLDACAEHGGYASDATGYVGTPAQGGDRSQCADILQALGYSGNVQSGTRLDGRGLGCHRFGGEDLWWLSSPAFDPEDSNPSAEVVCGCLE